MHSGGDLEAAVNSVLGYRQDAVKGRAVAVPPVPGLPKELTLLLQNLLPPKPSLRNGASRNGTRAAVDEVPLVCFSDFETGR